MEEDHKISSSDVEGKQQQQFISFGMIHHQPSGAPPATAATASSSSSPLHGGNFISKESGAYDLGELDQALILYLEGQQDHSSSSQEHRQTLNIFPSQPMHLNPSSKNGMGLFSSTSSYNKQQLLKGEPSSSLQQPAKDSKTQKEASKKATISSSEQEGPKTPDAKTLRRLAQNREAARKSRLRKKAYVQQLEDSRIRLAQLQQELQRARAQGVFFGGGGLIGNQASGVGSDAAMFDMEYARWLEEHHRLMCELRAAVQEHLPEDELRMFVDNCLAHYDVLVNLKSIVIRSDVFHLISGIWKTPAERCFLWIAGFRPSDLIKVVLVHIEPMTEQQVLGIMGLQQSAHETEEALSQGLEALYQSISETISSDALSYPSNMADYMGQMAMAVNKLSALEGFVRQADNLRQQTLHRLNQILTTRQAAHCFLAIADYFHRLRAVSSLWVARPRQE